MSIDSNVEEPFLLNDLNAPTLSGSPLKLFTYIVEHRYLGHFLRQRLLNTNFILAFREHTASNLRSLNLIPRLLPIFYPLPHHSIPPTLNQLDSLFNSLYSQPYTYLRKRPTIRDYHHAYSTFQITPLQVAETLLQTIINSNQSINALIRTNPEQLLIAARLSTDRWSRGQPLSVFDGVPFTVKDMIDVNGYPTRCAIAYLESDTTPIIEKDADVVNALSNAGMLMIGKCNQDEAGLGVRGFSVATGQTRNPHNQQYVPGGSSGGSAAAVATGLCPISIATDAGGSVRIPAACCGVYGLKPTFGRISVRGKVFENFETDEEMSKVTTIGPIADTAEDLALMYYIMAGFAPQPPIPSQPDFKGDIYPKIPSKLNSDMKGLRVGIFHPWLESSTPNGTNEANRVLERMVENGAEMVPVVIPDLEDIRVAFPLTMLPYIIKVMTKAGLINADGKPANQGIGWDQRIKLAMSREFTEDDVHSTDLLRTKTMEYAQQLLFGENGVDIILTPAIGIDTPLVTRNLQTGTVDVEADSKLMKFSIYANFVGLPAVVFPVAKGPHGLPIGVQCIAAPWQEETLLKVALWAQNCFDNEENLLPSHVCNVLDGQAK